MIYDPEHLVVFAFAFAESWLDRESGDRHGDQLQSGRLHSILDSLASICVRKGKGEVYAIAIQLQEHNGLGERLLSPLPPITVSRMRYHRISVKFGYNFRRLHRAITRITRTKKFRSNTPKNRRLPVRSWLSPIRLSHS